MSRIPLIDVNILPAQYRRAAISLPQILLVLGSITLLAVLGLLFLTLDATQAQTAVKETELAESKAWLADLPANTVDLTALQKQIDDLHTATERLRAEAQNLSSGQPSRVAGLALTIRLVVPGVTLAALTQSDRTYTVSGQAGSQAIVLDYARVLQSGATWRVRIVSLVNTDPSGVVPDVQFVIEMAE